MAALLELVLTGQVQSHVFISWLCNKLPKEDTPPVLSALAALQPEFVPYFLGYLREQAMPHIQDLQHSGLTPRKAVSVTKSDPHHARPHASPARAPAIRTKLNFETSESPAHSSPGPMPDRVVPNLEQRTRRKQRQNPSHDPEGQRSQNRPWSEQKSQQKLSLGQFITSRELPTGRKKGCQRPETTAKENMLNLNDQEAFPPMGTPAGKINQNVRRITPTPVKHRKACLPGATPVPPVVDNNLGKINAISGKSTADAVPSNLHLERELLKMEREKRLHVFRTPEQKETALSEESPFSECLLTSCSPAVDVEIPAVHPSEVKFGDQLSVLAQIYAGCMDANLTPGLVVELYFIVQLLTVRGKGGPDVLFDSETQQFLSSPSCCVHFAVHLLWLQRRLLQLLDKGTLRLLLENPRLKLFSPQLTEFLEVTCSLVLTGSGASVPLLLPSVGTAAFRSETDNRNNFVSDQEFHGFRKKRDSFCELLREWEANHRTPGWSTAAALGSRIRSLVFSGEATASSHLARLFQAQLLAMCKTNPLYEENDVLIGTEPLAALKQANPEKFQRLQERFVTPYHSAGPCPPPSFPGYQEFFKTFITAAASHSLNQHLIDSFTAKIHKMNNFQLSLAEGEIEKGQSIDADAREQFQTCLLALRLLAKFLGLIAFLPYRTSERIPESVLSSYIQLRLNTCPLLDLVAYLKEAIDSKRTVLVIPWIVEFLSMMDAAALYLPCYRQPLKMLFVLFRAESLSVGHPDFSNNQFLVILLLGWLFEVIGFWPTVPFEELDMIGRSNNSEVENSLSHIPANALDMLAIVDQSIIYTCCPYLAELRALLSEFAKGICSRAGSVRKIKPISAHRSLSELSSVKQMELEENFFRNQPVSMKRIVEFVIDRISSNVIKHVRTNVVEAVRSEASKKVSQLGDSIKIAYASQQVRMDAAKKILQLSKDVVEEMQTETMAYANDYCPKRVNVAMPVLLPDETPPEVATTCIKIVQRQVLKKVSQWNATNITTDVFYKELLNDLQKTINQSFSSKIKDCTRAHEDELPVPVADKHDEDVPSPTDHLITAKEILERLYTGEDFSESEVDNSVGVVRTIQDVIKSRGDLNPVAFKMLVQLTVDLAVALVIRHPGSLRDALEDNFIKIWLLYPTLAAGPLMSMLSRRNLQYLLVSEKSEASFVALEGFIQKCITAGLFPSDAFRETCIHALKQDWPQHFLLRLVECVGGIFYREQGAKIPSLEEWLAEPGPGSKEPEEQQNS